MPGILQVVQISFRKDASTSEIDNVLKGLANLKETCVKPDTRLPYISSVRWGKDVLPEGSQNGYSHMFVTEFKTIEDRDYYIGDPAHQLVVKALLPIKEKVQVLDIEI